MLEYDYYSNPVETMQDAGFTKVEDITNLLRKTRGTSHGDIYRNGKLFIRAEQ